MKQSSSPSLRLLAAATASDEAASMTSRPSYRGGRNQWRRGFSDQTSGAGDGKGQIVSGDAHFRSVRDANRGFRPRPQRPNFVNRGAFRPPFNQRPSPPPFNSAFHFNPSSAPPPPYRAPPPPFNPPPPCNAPPHFSPEQHFRPSFFKQNQMRPPPQRGRARFQKPLDYRNWEFAKPELPPHCERFTVLSYNILADYLAINHQSKLYFHIPQHMLTWDWRKRSIIFELGLWSADLLCFQEVDRFEDLEEELKLQGYNGIWKMRTGDPVDGCAIFWRVSRFKLLQEESIEFNKHGLRNNVAQICVLELLNWNKDKNVTALPTSSSGSNKVVICNIHVLYNPKRGDIKLGQIRLLLERAHAISKLWDDAPVVLCGDFNCTPKSPLYNYISEQKLNLSGLPRDKVSGQASAEIRPPRQFIPSFREVRQIRSLPDVQEQNRMDSSSRVNTGLIVSDSSSAILKCGNENGTLPCEVTRGIHLEEDDSKDEDTLTASSSVSVLKEASSNSQSEGNSFIEQMKNRCEDIVDSSHENVCSVVIETETNQTHQGRVDMYEDKNIPPLSVLANSLNESASPRNGGNSSVTERNDVHELYSATNSSQEYPDLVELAFWDKRHVGFDVQYDSSSEHQLNLQIESESIDQDDLLCGTSAAMHLKVPAMGHSENMSSPSVAYNKVIPSTSSEATISYDSTNIDSTIGKKISIFSPNEFSEINKKDESFGDGSETFLSELHGMNSSFSTDFSNPGDMVLDDDSPGLDSEPADGVNFAYDPSAWTPMEIETATGNADCTLMKHLLKLRSTYTEVEDCSGTRDVNGEPLATSYNRSFLGTVDYIWRSEGLQTVKVLAPIPKHAMQWTPGFPTKKWGSDHIALVSEFAFTKDSGNQNAEAP